METLGAATEAEMVAEFVRAERDSPRQGARQAAAAERLRTDDPVQLLAATRGYPDQYLFTGFPRNTTWRRVLLLRAEVADIRLYPFEEWKDYTRGTRRADELARELREGTMADQAFCESTARIAELYERGEPIPPIIVATDGRSLACIEGNTRLTSYLRSKAAYPLPALLGESPEMGRWKFF
ncbi:hypothetical protein SAMN05444161_6601 [Rhizobiales bacterium GAS191]|nr:hypothetical protein SAMN05444161_6601 [Rhizobiales bacterium GAS191]